MIILHVFLRIGALLQTPRPDPEEYDWDHESMDLGTPGQRQARTLPTHLLIVPETSPGGTGLG